MRSYTSSVISIKSINTLPSFAISKKISFSSALLMIAAFSSSCRKIGLKGFRLEPTRPLFQTRLFPLTVRALYTVQFGYFKSYSIMTDVDERSSKEKSTGNGTSNRFALSGFHSII